MVDVWRIAVNLVSLAINVGLMYFAVRLLLIFKGGKMGKAWSYVSYGVLTLAIGLFLFIFHSLLDLPGVVYRIGNTVVLAGGVLTLIGFYMQCKIWSQRG